MRVHTRVYTRVFIRATKRRPVAFLVTRCASVSRLTGILCWLEQDLWHCELFLERCRRCSHNSEKIACFSAFQPFRPEAIRFLDVLTESRLSETNVWMSMDGEYPVHDIRASFLCVFWRITGCVRSCMFEPHRIDSPFLKLFLLRDLVHSAMVFLHCQMTLLKRDHHIAIHARLPSRFRWDFLKMNFSNLCLRIFLRH